MSNRNLRIKRFEQRLQKTHERFGYISLEAIASSYFSYRKESKSFKSIEREELRPFNYGSESISLERLEQMRQALNKANNVQKLKREAA